MFLGVTLCSNQPTYHPSAIFQPKNGDEAQRITELTKESATCDEAIRSLVLAVGNEIAAEPEIAPQAQVSSLVESDFALVPPACQEVINPRSAASDGDLVLSVVEARAMRHRVQFSLRLTNTGEEIIELASDSRPDVEITDNQNRHGYRSYELSGVYTCYPLCSERFSQNFTHIDPGATATLTVRAAASSTAYYNRAQTASLALTLYEGDGENVVGTRSFGFVDVPLD